MKCYIKDYPRPQFMRTDWENLNGTWDFGFDDENAGEKEKWYQEFKGDKKINVPFTYETKLSGIQDETRHDFIWYHRTINVDGVKLENNRYILHFEGSDFITKVWVNVPMQEATEAAMQDVLLTLPIWCMTEKMN